MFDDLITDKAKEKINKNDNFTKLNELLRELNTLKGSEYRERKHDICQQINKILAERKAIIV